MLPTLSILACVGTPTVSVVAGAHQAFVGRGPHRPRVAVVDGEGREVRGVPPRLSVTGPAHVELGQVWCDGTGAVDVVAQAGGTEARVSTRCVYVAALRPLETAPRLVLGARLRTEAMAQAVDAAGRPGEQQRLAWTSSNPDVVDPSGRALGVGVTTVTLSAPGAADLRVDVEVVDHACVKVILDAARPDGAPWDPDGEPELALWIDDRFEGRCPPGPACVQRAPAARGCGPFRVRVAERDALVEGSSHDGGRTRDILLRLPTRDDDADDVVGEVSCDCHAPCSLPGATLAVVACPR